MTLGGVNIVFIYLFIFILFLQVKIVVGIYSDGQTQNSRFWKSNINVCLSHISGVTIASQLAVEVYHSVMYEEVLISP
jgi:hypothetical protein